MPDSAHPTHGPLTGGGSRPVRVQRRRTAEWQMPPGAAYVGRPTRWGNPCPVRQVSAEVAVARYRTALLADPARVGAVRRELGGRDLARWCPLDAPWCHADVLLDLAHTIPPTTSSSTTGGTR